MRLFLSSHNFGDFSERLRELTGNNCRTLLITNASDYNEPRTRQQRVIDKIELFKSEGFMPVELDLRKYFSKSPEELERFVNEFAPGLIFCIGGDAFLLATALNMSGMNAIIKQGLSDNKFVYGGSSAGAVVASEGIGVYGRDEIDVDEVVNHYGVNPITTGLGLINDYILPHVNSKKYGYNVENYRKQLKDANKKVLELEDTDVCIVNNNRQTVLRNGERI